MASGWRYGRGYALVTGASAGLGDVFARRLAERGSDLVLTARRGDRLERLAETIRRSHGVAVEVIPADLTESGAAERVWHQASSDGRTVDLLVNNAGFGAQGRFEEVDLDRHRAMLLVNCTALMELAHLALQDMKPRGHGGIINVSSVAAFQPVPLLASYAAGKAFVLSLSESLWAENRDHGIRVLALCPGRTPTEFQEVAGTGRAEGGFGSRTPEQVVDAGLRAFEAGKSCVVPGFENLAASWAVRALPRGSVLKAMKVVGQRIWGGSQ
ncbi:MAG: SDR family NAD(P)-dependent oxidoreductase [Gemmatimonas sp.]|nr:SDR family NAD(P)-dependent oxidoreductase [Gemmatimonas sp.]